MKVLIAIDDSACSRIAFDAVAKHTWPKETEFRIVSVVEPLNIQFVVGVTVTDIEPMLKLQEEALAQRKELVHEWIAELKEGFPDHIVTGVVLEGAAADCILREAAHFKAEAIVMGSHSRNPVQKFLLGSVAEKVMRYALCSVSVVRRPPS